MSLATIELSLIVARARNGVIGRNNALPWRLRDDLRQFKLRTLGHPIIMGRKTWESLGRPLPGRTHIVISRQPGYAAEGAQVVASLDEALAACAPSTNAFIIGGAQLYALALPRTNKVFLTEVDASVEGDAYFPALDLDRFIEISREHFAAGEGNDYAFDVIELQRR